MRRKGSKGRNWYHTWRWYRHTESSGMLISGFVVVMALFILMAFGINKKEFLAQLSFSELQLSTEVHSLELTEIQQEIQLKNTTAVTVKVVHRGSPPRPSSELSTSIADLGFEYSLGHRLSADQDDPHSLHSADLSFQPSRWEDFVDQLSAAVEEEPVPPELRWDEGLGWVYEEGTRGVIWHDKRNEQALDELANQLRDGQLEGLELALNTQPQRSVAYNRHKEMTQALYSRVLELTAQPLILDLNGEEVVLDLGSSQHFLRFYGSEVQIDFTSVYDWLSALAADVYTAPEQVRIVGQEEVRTGVFKAVTEGSFEEGMRIEPDEILASIRDHFATETPVEEEPAEGLLASAPSEIRIDVTVYEIPIEVFSELENQPYELLSVGYSEYSRGNATNRVHNIETGLDRLNGALVAPGEALSFNSMVGPINYDFRTGYGIFGPVARPILGGGICQVSTTFYRGLLNLGVPITMRRNHSWDLSYYRVGGYGLDATVFPSAGLDTSGTNDTGSTLFVYSYTRPETEEAFVLFYGVPDGRQVSLEPEQEYTPFYGPKTLRWTQTVEYADGTQEERSIVSRYRM